MAKQKNAGITVPNPWQLACERFKVKSVKESDNGVAPSNSSELALNQLLADCAGASAATFVNLLKSKGFQIIAPPELQDKSWDKTVGAKESMREGGPGSGRHHAQRTADIKKEQPQSHGHVEITHPSGIRVTRYQDGIGKNGGSYRFRAPNGTDHGPYRRASAIKDDLSRKVDLESMREAKQMEPAWVQDEDIWDKAKKVVTKTYGEPNYPVITFVYKNMGGKIKGKETEKKEAASGSAFAGVLRGRTKESVVWALSPHMRFLEAASSDENNPTRFRCILIQEGLGNFGDAYYYTREALVSAVAVFEGKKIYADHPDKMEEQTRPERSVKDVLGHFENVRLEEGKDGRSMLTADVVILPDEPYQWARALMRHAVEYSTKYPDKDFVGLSINAKGDATQVPLEEWAKEANIPASSMEKLRQAQEKGVNQIRLVTCIREAISCDMVTEAGAGGRIIKLIEGAKNV